MTHAEAEELLGAYALDAVEADEAAAIEEHLATCPRCRAELQNHREVVGLLAYAGQDAPEGLWDRVAARLHDDSPEAPPDASGAEAPGLTLRPLAGGAAPGHSPRRRRLGSALSLLAAAVVVVIALLGAEVVRLQNQTDHLSHQVTAMADQPSMATVRQALATPGARRITMRPLAGGGPSLDAVILPSGRGYLYNSSLVPLSPAQAYQLWGILGDQEKISYGLLGNEPSAVTAFQAGPGVRALAVTREVAGGVVSSTQAPVVVGSVS